MLKEKWEMTYNQYCEYILENSKYKEIYKRDKIKWENKKNNLLDEWYQILQDRAEVGDIPEIVVRDMIKRIGKNIVLRIFRGTKEKGLCSWKRTQIKKQYRESEVDNLRKIIN